MYALSVGPLIILLGLLLQFLGEWVIVLISGLGLPVPMEIIQLGYGVLGFLSAKNSTPEKAQY